MTAKRRRLLAYISVLGVFVGGAACLLWNGSLERRLERAFDLAYDRAMVRGRDGQVVRVEMPQALIEVESQLRDTGTNAIPVLLSWIEDMERPRSALKEHASNFQRRFKIRSYRLKVWTINADRHRRAYIAAKTFHVFKDEAGWAVPRLKQLAREKSDASTYAIQALEGLGERP